MCWLDEQIQVLDAIDATWALIQTTVRKKMEESSPDRRRLYASWSNHFCHIYEELKGQQHWEPSSPIRQRLLSLLKTCQMIKAQYPAFSPIWGSQNPVWPLSAPAPFSTLYGFELHLSGTDFWSATATGHYLQELSESLLLLRLFPHVDLFVDVGANVGFYSLLAAKAGHDALSVIAFEPERQNYVKLAYSIQSNNMEGKIRAFPMAIGSHTQKLKLRISLYGSGGHSVAPHESIQMSEEFEMVDSTTLDEAQQIQFPRYSKALVKIDVEGFEYEVLCGADRWLAATQAPIILFEAGTGRSRQRSVPNHILAIKKLRSFGYRVYPVLRPAQGRPPLGRACAPFRYKSPTINYLALPPHAGSLMDMLNAPVDLRLFTRREHLQSLLAFFNNSLHSLETE